MFHAAFCVLLALVVAPVPQAYDQHSYPFQVKPYAELVKMFDYDANAPLDLRQSQMLQRSGITVFDVSYRIPHDEKRTSAYLVVPPGKGPFPGVVFLHSAGGRDGFLPAAILLARVGVVSIALEAIDGMSFDGSMKHDILAIRRAFDVLASRGDVDTKRVGFVGHSRGSMMGSVVAGVDRRFKCFVIEGANLGMTYHVRFTQHPVIAAQRNAAKPEVLQKTLEAIAPFDAVHYIAHAAPASLLFQAARFDLGVTERESLDLFNQASQPKQLRWYESGHEMGNDPAAVKDRVEFLARQLGFTSPVPLLVNDMGLTKVR